MIPRTGLLFMLLSVAACRHSATIGAAGPRQPPPFESAQDIQRTWHTTIDRDHPLVGRIWDCRRRTFVDVESVWTRLLGARVVLLGEKHDNPDHHRLQAAALGTMIAGGRRPAVAFEMFDREKQAAIDQYRARPDATADGLGEATGWRGNGWPPFEAYLPIVQIAFDNRLPIVAANLPMPKVHALVHEGARALGPDASALGLDQPFPADLEASLENELRASHCGSLPDAMLAPMAVAQHARDAQMARALVDSDAGQGAVLIAGAGHVRLDRGVPYYLRQRNAGLVVASVAFVEVVRGANEPADYANVLGTAELPFDFVWFTPVDSDRDPCAAFKTKT